MNAARIALSASLPLLLSFSCAPDEPDDVGTIQLALKGRGSLGGQYQLTDAIFTVTGPVTRSISGAPDTINESLPVGLYTVKVEPGWTLKRIIATGPTNVAAALASPNPQPFVVNSAQTTQVTWLFNVSGANPDEDDLEVVAVTPGSLEILLSAGEVGWSNFSTGSKHSCGILVPGQLKCWGDNDHGQLGYGDTMDRASPAATPVNVGTGRAVRRVAVGRGGNFTCALLDDATIKCWGSNNQGQLGFGDGSTRTSPPNVVLNLGSSNTAKTIAAGPDFACAILDNNSLKCWGANSSGQLGTGDTVTRTEPPALPVSLGPGTAAKSVVAGAAHACALLSNNQIKCWGANGSGQLGVGDTWARPAPLPTAVNLGAGRSAKRVVAGYNHTCAILDNDTVKCWGLNSNGQLGYGDVATRSLPPDAVVNLGVGRIARRIAAGQAHTCALLDDNNIKCWGANNSGQLGYEDISQRSAPPGLVVDLGFGRLATRLLAGADHTCVLLADNGIKCWGLNAAGVFGTGAADDARGDQLNEMGDNLAEVLP